jgi:hypothetical protein
MRYRWLFRHALWTGSEVIYPEFASTGIAVALAGGA